MTTPTSHISKAVILARGLGTRMRRKDENVRLSGAQSLVADSGMKAMIPMGRPFLDFVVSGLADAGFTDICLVVGPDHTSIRDYYAQQIKPTRVRVHFRIQDQPLGTANAVLAARGFAGNEEFAVMNSDNYYPIEALSAIRTLGRPGAVFFEENALITNGNIPKERIKAFAYGITDDCGVLVSLVEKPDDATVAKLRNHALVSMNLWRFSTAIFEFCAEAHLSARGEYDLSEVIQEAVREGLVLKIVSCTAGVLDMSQRSDIPQISARLANIKVSL